MPAQRDKPKDAGGEAAAALALRLREAVRSGVDVKANGGGRNGSSPIAVPSPREIAIDVCSAILAETGAGTAEHSSDVVLITEAIGERMGIRGDAAGDLLAAARLHDIGKAWVPGRILEKPSPLSDEEWAIMRQHTLVGERILSSVDELQEVARLVRHSHERWDGGGYPDRLAGSEIPLGSRIIFCADSFHAIRSDRPYRSGRSAREAVAEINRCAGTQFDPQVAGALEQVVRERNRRPRGRGGGSSRLFALLMCLVIGGAGTAVARSGLLAEPSGTAPPASAPKPPPACGTAACPTVAGPVGGLGAVGALNGVPGPRPLHPGLPGQLHKRGHGKRGAGKSSGTHGKSAEAKARRAEKSRGKHKGQSGESHGNGEAAHSQSATAPGSPSGGGGGGSSHSSGGGHHSSASHSSGRSSSHGHSGGGGSSSNGSAGGNGNGNGHG